MDEHCVIGQIVSKIMLYVEAESDAEAIEMVKKMDVRKLLEDADPPEIEIIGVTEVKKYFYDDIEDLEMEEMYGECINYYENEEGDK